MIHFIFLVALYPSLFLMYFIQKGEGTSKYGTLFGIKYTSDWLPDEERKLLEQKYRHTMNRYLLIFAVTPFITLVIPYTSIYFTIWMLWMTVMIVMFMVPYCKGNSYLKKLKQERCPQQNSEEIRYVELKNAGIIRRVKWQHFVPPCIISIALAIFAFIYFTKQNLEIYGALIIIFALCNLLFYGFAVYMDRMKTKVISSDSDVNVNYTRASKNIFKDFWLQCTWLNVIFLVVLLTSMIMEAKNHVSGSALMIWSIVLYAFLTLYLSVKMVKKIGRLSRKYAKKMDLNIDEDEKYWIGGMFYFNPKDRHTMVNKRVGVGTTMNMATPAGMVFTAFTGVTLLSIPIICVWVILLEFTPISLFVDENVLIARHLRNDYVIATDTITELTLEDELPRTSRISGTGMDNLLKGNFRTSEDGRIQIFLNPQNQYYLRIATDNTIYYLGGYNDDETKTVYEILTSP
uniref:DUF5808 domain-containing protein n=1 Tax=Acetatifactor sp. TaxID=1872090 RepID=UPI004056C77D